MNHDDLIISKKVTPCHGNIPIFDQFDFLLESSDNLKKRDQMLFLTTFQKHIYNLSAIMYTEMQIKYEWTNITVETYK